MYCYASVFEDLRQWLAAAACQHIDVHACLRMTNQKQLQSSCVGKRLDKCTCFLAHLGRQGQSVVLHPRAPAKVAKDHYPHASPTHRGSDPKLTDPLVSCHRLFWELGGALGKPASTLCCLCFQVASLDTHAARVNWSLVPSHRRTMLAERRGVSS